MRGWMGVLVMGLFAACTTGGGPSPEKTASYFGLGDGKELTYQVQDSGGAAPTSARILISSDSSFADYLGFKAEERNAGNIVKETIIYGATTDDLRLLRIGDCLPNCTDFVSPVALLKNPMVANQNYTSETDTRVQTLSGTSEGPHERHEIQVGGEENPITPAGTFKAFHVSWRRFITGQAQSEDRQFWVAVDRGVVQIVRPSGSGSTLTYSIQSGVSP